MCDGMIGWYAVSFVVFPRHIFIFYFFKRDTYRQTKTTHHNQTTLESWLERESEDEEEDIPPSDETAPS